MVNVHPDHKKNLDALKRIEGQVRGLQKMIGGRRYCVDILTQISAVNNALLRVQDNVLKRHLNGCVKTAIAGKSDKDRKSKIDEIFDLLKKYRKSS